MTATQKPIVINIDDATRTVTVDPTACTAYATNPGGDNNDKNMEMAIEIQNAIKTFRPDRQPEPAMEGDGYDIVFYEAPVETQAPPETHSSTEWLAMPAYASLELVNTSGWDATDLQASMAEPITRDEFERRLRSSICILKRPTPAATLSFVPLPASDGAEILTKHG